MDNNQTDSTNSFENSYGSSERNLKKATHCIIMQVNFKLVKHRIVPAGNKEDLITAITNLIMH